MKTNAHEALKGYFQRWETLEEQKQALAEDFKALKAEIKGDGFEPRVLADLVKANKDLQKAKERLEITKTYADAVQLDLFP